MFKRSVKITKPYVTTVRHAYDGGLSDIAFSDGARATRNVMTGAWESDVWGTAPMTSHHWSIVWPLVTPTH